MRRFARILCPVDFSETSHHAVEHALTFARWYDASMTGLFVYTPLLAPPPGFGVYAYSVPPVVEHIETSAYERDVLAFVNRGDASGVRVSARIEIGLPAPAIVAAARSMAADLVVIGTHGIAGFEHMMLGSIAEKVLRTCPI